MPDHQSVAGGSPTPTTPCPRRLLEERILNLLSTQNVAVVATVAINGSPAATPVRYYSLGFEIRFTSWNASPKSRNLCRRPARLRRDRRSPGWPGKQAAAERGRSLDDPPSDPLTIISASRFVYTDHWLRRDGNSSRQIWRPADE